MTSRLKSLTLKQTITHNKIEIKQIKQVPIEINPCEVVFSDVQLNKIYEITIQIRNLTKNILKIRLVKPLNQIFKIQYNMLQQIAPGLSMLIKIKYQCKQSKNQSENIQITTNNNFKMDLPIRVYKIQSHILFEPFINLGFVKIGKTKIQKISFKNIGKITGIIEFMHNHEPLLSIMPQKLTLLPGEISFINLNFKSQEAGSFKGVVTLRSEAVLFKNTIDIHAISVQFTKFFIDKNGIQRTNFDFGSMYYGQINQIESILVNNSPKKLNFKSSFRMGIKNTFQEFSQVKGPSQLGYQQKRRIMYCEPQCGEVNPFSQIPVKFICKTKITYKQQLFTKNFAITSANQQSIFNKIQQIQHKYSLLFDFFQQEPVILTLRSQTYCPLIKLQKNMFQFGDCPSYESRYIKFNVQNLNCKNKVELLFPKIPNFSINPNSICLNNISSAQLIAIFHPKNIGKFETDQSLVLNKIYQIPLRFFGISSTIGKLQHQKNSSGLTLNSERTLIREISSIDRQQRNKNYSFTPKKFLKKNIFLEDTTEQKSIQFGQINKKQKYNKILKNRRSERINIQHQKSLQKKWLEYSQKNIHLRTEEGKQKESDQRFKTLPPIDYEFQLGMIDTKIQETNVSLPKSKDKLFVIKPIGQYIPLLKKKIQSKYQKSVNEKPKRIYHDKAKSMKQQRQISSQLTGDELQKLQINTYQINFGQIFVKSFSSKYFWINNCTNKSISVRLQINDQQLQKSYLKTQIIPSNFDAGFEIFLSKQTIGEVKKNIKYILNEKYTFQIQILAQIVPVSLELSQNNIKFKFTQDNISFTTTESIFLTNNGNSKATYKFILINQPYYIPDHIQGDIQSQNSKQIKISFSVSNPYPQKSIYNYNEKLILKIIDGLELTINCTCMISQPKLQIRPFPIMNFPIMCIGEQHVQNIRIKNLSKQSTVIYFQDSKLQGLQYDTAKYGIQFQNEKIIQIRFKTLNPGMYTTKLMLNIRGCKTKVIQVNIKIINPIIQFDQIISFQKVYIGNKETKIFKLQNKSEIDVCLTIDLTQNHNHDIQCLQLKILNQSTQEYQNQDNITIEDTKQSEEYQNLSNSSQEEQKNSKFKKYNILLKSNILQQFQIKFCPQQVKDYQFKLPFYVANFIPIQSPVIKCQVINQKIILYPRIVNFKNKYIYNQQFQTSYVNITIKNTDTKQICWNISDAQIRKQQIFTLQKNSGILAADQIQIFKAGFSPNLIGQFHVIIPLFVKDENEQNIKYLQIQLKGKARYPTLTFNKRELILPVVPIGIISCNSFTISNKGYENVNIKTKFIDFVNLNLQINFPQGKNLSVAKKKINVEIKFKYLIPISFCIMLQIYDEMNRTYVIPISGTTDNSIFTNYSYFLRSQGKYKIQIKQYLQLTQQFQNDSIFITRKNEQEDNNNETKTNLQTSIGIQLIHPHLFQRMTLFLKRYLNSNFLITKINQFPEDFIHQDGVQLFQILQFFNKKRCNFTWKCKIKQKGVKKVQALYQQYCELIKLLKLSGAHLNHIRPQYLLSFNDLNLYLSQILKKQHHYPRQLLKINLKSYNYLSRESWISLLYQIFRIYISFGINLNTYKSYISQFQKQTDSSIILEVPKCYMNGSNYICCSQGILIYWIQSVALEILHQQIRISNFDKDFRDGILIAALLKKYTNLDIVKNMKKNCSNENDLVNNSNQIKKGLEVLRLDFELSQLDIINPLPNQMLLFLFYLYYYLPNYTPKSQPIQFKCILGQQIIKYIQLSNPSNNSIFYQTKYQGSSDFTLISNSKFQIKPKQAYKFQIKYKSKTSTRVFGRVTFINRKQSGVGAATVAFDIQSSIIKKNSEKIWNVVGNLYKKKQFCLEIINKFQIAEDQVVQFTITQTTQYVYNNKNINLKILSKSQQIPTIFLETKSIKLKSNQSIKLRAYYIPISLNVTKTTIIFCNPIIGEFQHQIIATSQLPESIMQIRPPNELKVDQIMNWKMPIEYKNNQLIKAKEMIQEFQKDEEHFFTEQLSQNSEIELFIQLQQNSFIKAAEKVMLIQKKKLKYKSYQQKKQNTVQNIISFTITCVNPIYQKQIILKLSNSKLTDVRTFKIMLTIFPRPLKAIIQIKTPARTQITQNLPIINNTDKDWTINVIWSPNLKNNGNLLTILPQFIRAFPVKKKSTRNFPLKFHPDWIKKAESKLILQNPITMDHFQYQIIGIGQEPLSEAHIQLKCQTKKKTKKQILVRNPFAQKISEFNVNLDLLDSFGVKNFIIPAKGTYKYELSVQPILSGEYTGTIIFTQKSGEYFWYTISVITTYPKIYKTIKLKTYIRKQLLCQLQIPSQSNSKINYEVSIKGIGLNGESLYNSQQKIYILKYLPFKVGFSKGYVCFMNSSVGEIYYEFDLNCEKSGIIEYPELKSPIGIPKIVNLQFYNPSQLQVNLNLTNSNFQVFQLQQTYFTLLPFKKKQLKVIYIPSNIQKLQQTKIIAVSQEIGDWQFHLKGIGISPPIADIHILYSDLFQEKTTIIAFENPFKYSIKVGFKLDCESNSEQVFKLIGKNVNKIVELKPKDILQIMVSFIPKMSRKYECKLVIMLSQKMKWIYPIQGITQINTNKIVCHLKVTCRQQISQQKQIYLKGLKYSETKQDKFSYRLQNIPNQKQILVQKFFLVQFLKSKFNHQNDCLKFLFIYKPLKPQKFKFDFVIINHQGARWRFQIILQSLEPQPDDIISFQNSIFIKSTISFKLTNWQTSKSYFQTRFSKDSAIQFSVQPKQGQLSYQQATNFFVSFTPIQFGQQKKGKLIIETSSMFWSYSLKGNLPKYVKPLKLYKVIQNNKIKKKMKHIQDEK